MGDYLNFANRYKWKEKEGQIWGFLNLGGVLESSPQVALTSATHVSLRLPLGTACLAT